MGFPISFTSFPMRWAASSSTNPRLSANRMLYPPKRPTISSPPILGSCSRISAQSAKTAGFSSVPPATSTGLRTEAPWGRIPRSLFCVFSASSGISTSRSVNWSAAMVACPPPSARMAMLFFLRWGKLARVSAAGNSSSEFSMTIMPALRKAVLATSEIPASAPVWEPAESFPVLDLPPFNMTIGFFRVVW